MSCPLNSLEIAGMQEAEEGLLPETGTLQNPGSTPDGEGGVTGDWTTATANVPFRINYGLQASQEHLVAEEFQGQTRCTLTFEYAQTISTKQRVVLGSRIFYIHGWIDEGSNGIVKTAYCTEIQT